MAPRTVAQCTVSDGAAHSQQYPGLLARLKLGPVLEPQDPRAAPSGTLDPKTGRILGYAQWHIPPDPEEEAEIRRVAETAFWDPNTGPDVFIEVTRPVKNEILARKPYMRLEYLAVHPDNQGKGVGTALVESGMRQAEKMGLDIFIHAMKMGMRVYKRLGFRGEKEPVMDGSHYGGDGDYRVWFLIYEQNRKPDI
ncbi:acetyltransferase [Seiridium cupressi]